MTWIFGPFVSVSLIVFAVSSLRLLVVLWRATRMNDKAGEVVYTMGTADRWVLAVFITSGIALCYGIPNHL